MALRRHRITIAIVAFGAAATLAHPHAQQPPAPKILVAGENPAITLRDKEAGAGLTSVNFWRVYCKETCKSDTHAIEFVWRGFSEPAWVDIRPGANALMTFTMVMASGADVVINGKKAPGGVFRGWPGSFPPSFLALNHTWRRRSRAERLA